MDDSGKQREIDLGENVRDVVVKINGVRIEVGADSHVIVRTRVGVELQQAASDDAQAAPRIGDEMEDGTIYAGISPDTGRAMYTMPADAVAQRWIRAPRLTHTFDQAQTYAQKLDAHGHRDWRAPTKDELNVLRENRDKGKLKGTFNDTGSNHAGWYWSSSPKGYHAWAQRFSDGFQGDDFRNSDSSLRCVRG